MPSVHRACCALAHPEAHCLHCQAFPASPDRGGSGAVDSVACRPTALDEHASALQVRCGRGI